MTNDKPLGLLPTGLAEKFAQAEREQAERIERLVAALDAVGEVPDGATFEAER